jgi:hypothetical protein
MSVWLEFQVPLENIIVTGLFGPFPDVFRDARVVGCSSQSRPADRRVYLRGMPPPPSTAGKTPRGPSRKNVLLAFAKGPLDDIGKSRPAEVDAAVVRVVAGVGIPSDRKTLK